MALSTLFTCSNDGDNFVSPVQADLSGVWNATAYEFEGRTTTISPKDVSFYDFTGVGGKMEFNMVFTENPNEYFLDGFYFLDHTIITDEGDIYMFTDFNTFDDDGTWTINGNNITLIQEGTFTIVGISNLTETSLILRINTTESETLGDNATTISTNKQETYKFERN